MNGDVKVLDQNPGSNPVSGSMGQPQGGSPKKEAPFIAGLPEIKPAGPEVRHNIDQESARLEIKEIQDKPDLTQIENVQHAGPHMPVSTTSSGSIQYQMSEEEIRKQEKEGQDDDSGKWFLALWKKIIAWGSKPR